ncbi:MAG: hypothetical protein ABI045_06770 [Flavobacteriales bacterium]
MSGYFEERDEILDWKIYQHFLRYKYNPPIHEAIEPGHSRLWNRRSASSSFAIR